MTIDCGLDLPIAVELTVRGQQYNIEDGDWTVSSGQHPIQFEYNISIGGQNYNMRVVLTNYNNANYYICPFLVRDGNSFAVELRARANSTYLDYITYKVYLAK